MLCDLCVNSDGATVSGLPPRDENSRRGTCIAIFRQHSGLPNGGDRMIESVEIVAGRYKNASN
jgi:hypothetical protein